MKRFSSVAASISECARLEDVDALLPAGVFSTIGRWGALEVYNQEVGSAHVKIILNGWGTGYFLEYRGNRLQHDYAATAAEATIAAVRLLGSAT